jgi:hypothetical protein
MPGRPASNEILFARLLGPSEEIADDGSQVSSADSPPDLDNHPVMAELISRGVLEDDHMSAAQIQGMVRRHLIAAEVERAQQEQARHQEEAASFIQDLTVPSDYNMMAFMELIRRVGELRALTWIRHCIITDHRQAANPFLEGLGVPIQVVVPQALLCNGTRVPLAATACVAENCERCTSGRGGYRFAWRGPWTCLSCSAADAAESRRLWQQCMNTRGCSACRRCQAPLEPRTDNDNA